MPKAFVFYSHCKLIIPIYFVCLKPKFYTDKDKLFIYMVQHLCQGRHSKIESHQENNPWDQMIHRVQPTEIYYL